MKDSTLQITIRGIDLRTKKRLSQIASSRGVSLNSMVVSSLKQAAGTGSREERMQLIKETLHQNRISSPAIAAAETAVSEMDVVSKAKQKRDDP